MRIYLFIIISLFVIFLVAVISYKRMLRNEQNMKLTVRYYRKYMVVAALSALCTAIFFLSVWFVSLMKYLPVSDIAKLEDQFYSGMINKRNFYKADVLRQKKILSALNIKLESSRNEYATLQKWIENLNKEYRDLVVKVEKQRRATTNAAVVTDTNSIETIATLKQQWDGCTELPILYITTYKNYAFSHHECWRFYVKKVEGGYIGAWWHTVNRKITDYYELKTRRIINKDYYSDDDHHEELLFLFNAPMKKAYHK